MKQKINRNKYFKGYKKLKHVKLFESFVNEFDLQDDQEDPIDDDQDSSYKNHKMYNHIITADDARKLVGMEDDDLAPGEEGLSDEEFDKACEDITGKKLGEYAEERWPDEPQEQFNMCLKELFPQMTIKTDDGMEGRGTVMD